MKTFEEEKEEFLDSLEHAGVKGMKWGQRKAARQANDADIRSARQKVNEKASLGQKVLNATTYGKIGSGKLIPLFNSPSGKLKVSDIKKAGEYTSGEKRARNIILGASAVMLVGGQLARLG